MRLRFDRHRIPFPVSLLATGVWLATTILIRPIPVAAAEIGPDGFLAVDGSPVFPLGLVELGTYKYPDWAERIESSGANIVWDIEIAYADTLPSCPQVFEASAAGGWYLLVGSGDTWNWDDPSTPEYEVDQAMYEPDELEALIDCAATRPGRLVGFANRDEPSWTISRNMIGDIDGPHVHETYTQLHTAVPGAFVAMNHAPAQLTGGLDQWKIDVASFAPATDVMMFASYPYPAGPGTCGEWNVLGYPECKMDRLVEGADIFLGELNRPGQPLWMIVQAHKGIPLKEARWEAWASIVHGATGVFWAGWTWEHWLGSGEQNWPITRQVISELAALQPYLTGRDVSGAETDNPDIEVRAIRRAASNPQVLLVAISRNGFTGSASIRLPRYSAGRVQVLYEGRRLNPNGGWITDSFDGYQAHVYEYQGHGLSDEDPWGTDAPEVAGVPDRFDLTTYPNPSRGRATARFSLPRPAAVIVSVYDAAGRRVALVGRGNYGAGTGEMIWDGRDDHGRDVAPGVYFLRGRTSEGQDATARVLIRR